MPFDNNVSTDWTQVVTAAAEIWQVRAGKLLITEGVPTDDGQGIIVEAPDGVRIASGKTINYRKVGGAGKAQLAREEFE